MKTKNQRFWAVRMLINKDTELKVVALLAEGHHRALMKAIMADPATRGGLVTPIRMIVDFREVSQEEFEKP